MWLLLGGMWLLLLGCGRMLWPLLLMLLMLMLMLLRQHGVGRSVTWWLVLWRMLHGHDLGAWLVGDEQARER